MNKDILRWLAKIKELLTRLLCKSLLSELDNKTRDLEDAHRLMDILARSNAQMQEQIEDLKKPLAQQIADRPEWVVPVAEAMEESYEAAGIHAAILELYADDPEERARLVQLWGDEDWHEHWVWEHSSAAWYCELIKRLVN